MSEPATDLPQTAPAATGDAPQPRNGYLAAAALTWLVVTLLLGRRSLASGTGDFNLWLASGLLPALIQASLIAGGGAALWTTARLAATHPAVADGARRTLLGVGAGLVAGAFASGVVLILYGVPAAGATVMAAAIGVAGALGGGLCMIRPRPVLVAGLTGALVMVVVKYVVYLFDDQLLSLFGAGTGAAGDFAANGWLAFTTAAVAGISAGAAAYRRLRSADHDRSRPSPWPAYAAAGATAGLMLAVAEFFVRVCAPWMLSFADSDVTVDQLFQSLADSSRLNTGLVVLFAGTITAMVLIGRTLPTRR